MREHYISIWFFIGALLTVYGALILGAGIYHLFSPPAQTVVMAYLHADIWWGAVILLMGLFYVIHFRPGRAR